MRISSFFQGDKTHHLRDLPVENSPTDETTGLYREKYFNDLLKLEQTRSERSENFFMLMLIDLRECGDHAERSQSARQIRAALTAITRTTDIKGWYINDKVMGIIFTEIKSKGENGKADFQYIPNKCCGCLGSSLGYEDFSVIGITCHIFPDHLPSDGASLIESHAPAPTRKLHLQKSFVTKVSEDPLCSSPTMLSKSATKPAFLVKRIIDIVGSLLALIILAPLFLGIVLSIRLTSKGPAIFRQERLGFRGKPFSILKFRSMYLNNNQAIHQDFVRELIQSGRTGVGQENAYKIKADPRVTPIGKFFRKTSLDELPQFINVLKGDMSLVGPRPPIPYESDEYNLWHRRRFMEMKPGITGLWQVKGRSRTTFDEMVRMDIQYIREWSLWLDLKLLILTPWAVFTGKGAC